MSAETVERGSVVVVGSLNADHVMTTDRRPELGETVGNAQLQVLAGGKGTNQAVAAARCGAAVSIVGKVGRDSMGRFVVDVLDDERVDTGLLIEADAARSGVAFIVVTPNGKNSILVAPGANADLSPGDIDRSSAAIGVADVLVAQLEIPVETVERAIQLAPDSCRTILNFSPYVESARRLVAQSTVVVVNEHEAESLTGVAISSPSHAERASEVLLSLGAGAAIVTLGAKGAVFSIDGQLGHIPSPDVEVVDTTGAGDAFVGALAASLARGSEFPAAVAKATAAGAATTTSRGAFSQAFEDREDDSRAGAQPSGKVN